MADSPQQIVPVSLGVASSWQLGSMMTLALLLTGCPSPTLAPLDPMPIDQTVGMVNDNLPSPHTGLRARGRVTVDYTDPDGSRHRRFLDATLLVIAPRYVRFDMSVVGKTQMLLGSNDEKFWFYLRQDGGVLRWGHHDRVSQAMPTGMPVRPDMLIEALGLNRLADDTTGPAGPVQRIQSDHQQLLFLAYDDADQGYIRKEYWIERSEGGRPRRIIFRDPIGRVVMQSQLDDYRRTLPTGPVLPTRVTIDWPLEGGRLTFHISRWELEPRLTEEAATFALPDYPSVICIDDDPA